MNEKDEQDENSDLYPNSKPFSIDAQTINNNYINNNNNNDNDNDNDNRSENSQEEDINKIMIDLIKKLIKTKKEGKTNEDFYTIVPPLLKNINSNITKIIDTNNNTLAHLLLNEENNELLMIICNIYYILLINKNEFYDWFLKENNDNLNILDIASIKCNKFMLEFLYEIISRTDGSKLKFTIKKNNFFHFSAKYNQYYSILFWYDKLQPYFPYLKLIDLSNAFDITPLHYACYHGAINCVDLLLDLGADINAIDKDGKSPLIYAVSSGDITIVKKLLIRGADKTIEDSEGKTPYYYAVKNGKLDVARLLRNYSILEQIINFFCCKCNKKFEIKQLKNNRFDFEILLFLLLYFLFTIIFGIRTFTSDYNVFESKLSFLKLGICCLIANYFFIVISLIFIIYFKCIIRFNQHIKKNKKNFLAMYNKSNTINNICIKCIRMKKQNTIHCLVCNLCIDDWDHHCFWLNCCISKNNTKMFCCFLISIFCFLFINSIFCLSILVMYFVEKDKEIDNVILRILNNEMLNDINILKYIFLSFFFIIFFLFSYLFIYNFFSVMFSSSKKRDNLNENETRDASYTRNNNEDFHGDIIDSLIDKSDE